MDQRTESINRLKTQLHKAHTETDKFCRMIEEASWMDTDDKDYIQYCFNDRVFRDLSAYLDVLRRVQDNG